MIGIGEAIMDGPLGIYLKKLKLHKNSCDQIWFRHTGGSEGGARGQRGGSGGRRGRGVGWEGDGGRGGGGGRVGAKGREGGGGQEGVGYAVGKGRCKRGGRGEGGVCVGGGDGGVVNDSFIRFLHTYFSVHLYKYDSHDHYVFS